MRTLLIAGNWKMNPATHVEAVALAEAVKSGVGQETSVRVVLCPPAVFLGRGRRGLWPARRSGWVPRTCTGNRSGRSPARSPARCSSTVGCTHVILGHSERRHGMGETDAQVNAKLRAALAAGLIPIVCIGETKEERQADETERGAHRRS